MALPREPLPIHPTTEELCRRAEDLLRDTASAIALCRYARDECRATVARCRQMNPGMLPAGATRRTGRGGG
jgi:hypothetical protein